MKKILVALASLAIALAANFGIASAHPFRDPTPPAEPTPRVDQNTPATTPDTDVEVEQEGDVQKADKAPSDTTADANAQDEDQADLDVQDEIDNETDEDANDDDDAATKATSPRTMPVITTGKPEQERHGNNGQSGKSGHDDDD
jgi:hypothetical protein